MVKTRAFDCLRNLRRSLHLEQGSVEASLTLLDLARRRLDNARIPHKETVKNALAQDMALLRTYRTRDTSDLFTQIDSLLKIIDDLPLKLELTSDPAKIKDTLQNSRYPQVLIMHRNR